MSVRGTKAWTLAAIALLALLAGLVAAGWFVIGWQIGSNDARWCATLSLLTARPVTYPADPAANPSRVEAYRLYANFVTLREEFHC